MKKINADYDPEIMAQLLAEPGVIEKVVQMTPDEQDFFKVLLVIQGTYKRYLAEQQRKQIKEMIGSSFQRLRKKAREVDEVLRGDDPGRVVKLPPKQKADK